jgi:hypothetical protein
MHAVTPSVNQSHTHSQQNLLIHYHFNSHALSHCHSRSPTGVATKCHVNHSAGNARQSPEFRAQHRNLVHNLPVTQCHAMCISHTWSLWELNLQLGSPHRAQPLGHQSRMTGLQFNTDILLEQISQHNNPLRQLLCNIVAEIGRQFDKLQASIRAPIGSGWVGYNPIRSRISADRSAGACRSLWEATLHNNPHIIYIIGNKYIILMSEWVSRSGKSKLGPIVPLPNNPNPRSGNVQHMS